MPPGDQDAVLDVLGAHPVWRALGPALFALTWFLGGLAVYTVRWLLRGKYHDRELEGRPTTVVLGLWLRLYFAWLMQPLWHLLRVIGVPPSAVTTLSVALSSGGAVALASGRFALGGWLCIAGGICDFLDGRLARANGTASPRGAALDSVLDRYSDAVVLGGLAWYYRGTWVLLAALLALSGSLLVSYVRAKGEGLGVQIKEGTMQRAERVAILGSATALTPLYDLWFASPAQVPMHWLAVAALVLVGVSGQATAMFRLLALLRRLPGAGPDRVPHGRAAGRWLLSAILATGADFALVAALVGRHAVSPWVATALGCALGGVLNYAMNRSWTFRSTGARHREALRYTFVSASSALLNAGGVALLVPLLDYRLAWVVTRALLFVAWNYQLHREYVFVDDDGPRAADTPAVAPPDGLDAAAGGRA